MSLNYDARGRVVSRETTRGILRCMRSKCRPLHNQPAAPRALISRAAILQNSSDCFAAELTAAHSLCASLCPLNRLSQYSR